MSLSPYYMPRDNHAPNGIAHYVPKDQRPTVKALYAEWNRQYKAAYLNNQTVAPFNWQNLYVDSPTGDLLLYFGGQFNLN